MEERIVAAIVSRLSILHRGAGGFLAFVGQMPVVPTRMTDRASFDQMLVKLKTQAPAALVVCDQGDVTQTSAGYGSRAWTTVMKISVVLISTHLRDTVAGRLNIDQIADSDPARDPGLRVATEIVQLLLNGWRPLPGDPCNAPLRGVSWRTVFARNAMTMRELMFEIDVDTRRSDDPSDAVELAEILSHFNLVPRTEQEAEIQDVPLMLTELT
ncbi:MAG: hypothetical protein ACPGVG_15535 [Mycobacterium sp.]